MAEARSSAKKGHQNVCSYGRVAPPVLSARSIVRLGLAAVAAILILPTAHADTTPLDCTKILTPDTTFNNTDTSTPTGAALVAGLANLRLTCLNNLQNQLKYQPYVDALNNIAKLNSSSQSGTSAAGAASLSASTTTSFSQLLLNRAGAGAAAQVGLELSDFEKRHVAVLFDTSIIDTYRRAKQYAHRLSDLTAALLSAVGQAPNDMPPFVSLPTDGSTDTTQGAPVKRGGGIGIGIGGGMSSSDFLPPAVLLSLAGPTLDAGTAVASSFKENGTVYSSQGAITRDVMLAGLYAPVCKGKSKPTRPKFVVTDLAVQDTNDQFLEQYESFRAAVAQAKLRSAKMSTDASVIPDKKQVNPIFSAARDRIDALLTVADALETTLNAIPAAGQSTLFQVLDSAATEVAPLVEAAVGSDMPLVLVLTPGASGADAGQSSTHFSLHDSVFARAHVTLNYSLYEFDKGVATLLRTGQVTKLATAKFDLTESDVTAFDDLRQQVCVSAE